LDGPQDDDKAQAAMVIECLLLQLQIARMQIKLIQTETKAEQQ
jgi:hypothetical protein